MSPIPPLVTPSDLVALRRDLHAHPELRFTERETQGRLRTALTDLIARSGCVASLEDVADTGLLLRLPSPDHDGQSVLLRADMDAYPVTETTGLPYASTRPGVTHACGHDIHMTVLVGVVAALLADPPRTGSVTALFQPGEEIPYGQPSGARTVINSGALADSYDAVLGLHCWPELPAGRVGINPEISMAAKDAFRLEVIGRAAHVASAARGRDAILAAAMLVQTLHSTVARRQDAESAVAFNIGTVTGGASQSQLAPNVTMTGTLRTLEPEVRQRLRLVIEQVTAGVAAAQDVHIELTWSDEMPAVVNDPGLVAAARRLGADGLDMVDLPRSPMTADDFALLTGLGPGLYLKLGSAPTDDPTPAPLHNGGFRIDEDCIPVGVRALELLTRRVLGGVTDPLDGVATPLNDRHSPSLARKVTS